MPQKIQKYLARASLDNLKLSPGGDSLRFNGFSIKKSPNCVRDITVTNEDGKETTIPHSPDEDEYEPGFPRCQYYLELELARADPFGFDEAQAKTMWALNRMRLFKPGLLWGELYGIFDPNEHPVGVYEFRRSQENGPMPTTFSADYDGIFQIQESELDSIVDFVNDLKDIPTDQFAVALRRFHLYFDRDSIQDRAIDLMVALESLFSEDQEAIAYKIALRASCLIETESQKRKAIFDFLKKAYGKRSRIVHGKDERSWFESKTYNPKLKNIIMLEEVVRKSLLALLRRAQQGTILKAGDLDDYLFLDRDSLQP